MKLSVIIVNYNVRYFLEQCLLSVKRACLNIEAEVIVVDNASADDSAQMVSEKFPAVKLIVNKENVGFSRANNQAIKEASGEYVLLLNPDTIVAENTFEKCITFMDGHAEAGALGVQMVDGKGNFLPESKRGLPTPAVAFYKTFGLAALFPKSKTFGRYHLGFLNENETHEVDILSGAFMFMRKSALDKTGLLDEAFFMYGEDVDLSYRILKAGYKNYYFPDTTIIHYKGESTKKGSLNYVRVFYNAMIIFARKHFSGNQSSLFSLLIHLAIVFRGGLTLLSSLFASSYLFIVDAALSFGGIFFIKAYWENSIKYAEHYYPNQFLFAVVPLYILIWILATFFSGGYDKPFRISKILRGIALGTIAIAVLYAFLPNEWRFSRAMILLGAAWTGLEMILTRMVYHLIRYQSFSVENFEEERSLIIGKQEEAERAEKILRTLGRTGEINQSNDLNNCKKAAAIFEINELIFCSSGMAFSDIIQQIKSGGAGIDYKILNEGSDALIGSNSKEGAGDLYVAEKSYALFRPENRRRKRWFDVLFCLALLPLLPINIFLVKNFGQHIANWRQVLKGTKSWVGFSTPENSLKFPPASRGILHPADRMKSFQLSREELVAVELTYARHYSVRNDLFLLLKNYRELGQ